MGTTELTLANVPNISLIKYEWAAKNGNFKVVSSSKNKAVLTPSKYSEKDVITVTPKVQLVSLPEIERLGVSTDISSANISIKGNDYISPELEVYSLSAIPDDVSAVTWTASNGVVLTPYEDMTTGAIVAKAEKDRWIQAAFTSYGVTHEIRKDLKVATLDSISMKMLKHWRNKEEELDKYYFHIDIYPATSIEEMDFCWYNTVKVTKKTAENGLIGIIDKPGVGLWDGAATIKTDGNVGACRRLDPVIPVKPIDPIIKFSINDLPEITAEPFLTGKNEAIVSMPKIGTDEIAKGNVLCDVRDKFGTKYTVSYAVESKWSSVYCATPNPANSVIVITKVVDDADASVSAYGLDVVTARLYSGQSLVREQELGINGNRIDVGDLPDGTYYLNVVDNGEVVLKQTVIIKH